MTHITGHDLGILYTISTHIQNGTFASWVRSLKDAELAEVKRVFTLAKQATTEMQEESMLEIIKLKAIEADKNLDVSEAKQYLKKFQLNPS